MTARPAPAAIRILVADDHPTTREGLALILDHEADMAVVAQARDGAGAWFASCRRRGTTHLS